MDGWKNLRRNIPRHYPVAGVQSHVQRCDHGVGRALRVLPAQRADAEESARPADGDDQNGTWRNHGTTNLVTSVIFSLFSLPLKDRISSQMLFRYPQLLLILFVTIYSFLFSPFPDYVFQCVNKLVERKHSLLFFSISLGQWIKVKYH